MRWLWYAISEWRKRNDPVPCGDPDCEHCGWDEDE